MCCSLEKGIKTGRYQRQLHNTNEFSASSNVSQSIWCKHLEHLLLRDPTLIAALLKQNKKEGANKKSGGGRLGISLAW
jgi:hypothetical protein